MQEFQTPEWVTWVFSGAGVAVGGYFLNAMRKKGVEGSQSQTNSQNVEINLIDQKTEPQQQKKKDVSIDELRAVTKIIFIDDDSKFKVVDILKRAGWQNTKSIRDIKDLNSTEVRDTHIFFVDIHGVGVSLGFKDEGLGLASAIKDKYKEKKVIIYSGETQGERFHDALKKADDSLPKNADPYEFEQIIENFSKEIFE
ncbi:hypothetical protein [Endozoicomonas sp. ALE010]|uniref:hypothetical protein n=1 Tax=Endozoicomonas sp. ALE010 TaxID=3403081 RepID=UPI003BB51365